MADKKTDISQIRKYLRGELDARAMHQLERQAQDDPFLMDALDGYSAKADQQPNLDELQQRLQARLNAKQAKRLALWPMISVAASVLFFVAIGGWWLLVYQPRQQHRSITGNRQARQEPKTPPSPQPQKMPVPPSIIDSNAVALAKAPRKHEVLRQRRTGAIIEPSSAVVVADAAGADTIVNKGQLDEVNVIGYGVARRREVTASVSTINPKPVAEELAGRVAGVNIQQKSPKIMLRGLNTADSLHNPLYVVDGKIRKDIYKINPDDLASVKVLKNTEATALYGSQAANGVLVINTKKALGRTGSDYQLKEVPISPGYASKGVPRVISGQVVDEQGHPLPGAQVKVVGKNIGIATDVNGRFQLNIADGDQLSVGYIGYNSKQLVPDSRNNLKVSLTPSSAGLSEVVVVGYGTKKDDEQAEDRVSENARPSNGWAAYNKYLKEQSKVDSKEQTGKVRLSFVVNPDGSLTGFQILKNLNKDADENAIMIIKDGPGWKGATNGKPEKVKITIRFHQ